MLCYSVDFGQLADYITSVTILCQIDKFTNSSVTIKVYAFILAETLAPHLT